MERDIDCEQPRDHRTDPSLNGARERETRRRQSAREGRQVYSISPDQRQTMYDIGRFRTLDTEDLAGWRYLGREAQMHQDLRYLVSQRLIESKTVWTGRDRETVTYLALTKGGKRLLKGQSVVPGQAIYAGFVKPSELYHDAAIYPVFRREESRILGHGGQIRRVVLDYELKKKAYSPLAKAKALPPAEYARRQTEIAREHGLKVINGHIALPDLRIEYVDRHGVAAQIDIEVATESYHGSHAAEKAAAGFKIYAPQDTAVRLSRALEEREITAEILWL